MVETLTPKNVEVGYHGPLSLYTKLEGPRIAKLDDIHRLTALGLGFRVAP